MPVSLKPTVSQCIARVKTFIINIHAWYKTFVLPTQRNHCCLAPLTPPGGCLIFSHLLFPPCSSDYISRSRQDERLHLSPHPPHPPLISLISLTLYSPPGYDLITRLKLKTLAWASPLCYYSDLLAFMLRDIFSPDDIPKVHELRKEVAELAGRLETRDKERREQVNYSTTSSTAVPQIMNIARVINIRSGHLANHCEQSLTFILSR